MPKNFNNRALEASQKVYGWLLRAYPPAHRKDYGQDMAQLFRDQGRDAWNEAQNWGLVKLWLRVFPDLVSTAIREQLAALQERKSMNDKIASLSNDRTTPTAIFIRVALAVFLITAIAATLITFILPETYASTARIRIQSAGQNEVSSVGGLNAPQAYQGFDPYFIQTTFEIMQSGLVLSNVVTGLRLNTVWGKKYFNGETLKTSGAIEILRQRLQLNLVRNTQLIAITAFSEDKNEAAQIANAVAQSYRDYRNQSLRELVETEISALQKQVEQVEGKISQSRKELDILRQQFNISNEATRPRSVQENPYFEKKLAMDEAVVLQDQLQTNLAAARMALKLPQTTLVQITDRAEPGRAPVRPNKTLNIVIGVVAGGFLGLVAGGASALVSFKFGNRGRTNVASV